MSFSHIFFALFSSAAAYRPDELNMAVALQLHSASMRSMRNSTVVENTPSQSLTFHVSDKAHNETITSVQHQLGSILPGSIMSIYSGLQDLKVILEDVALRRKTVYTNLGSDVMSLLDSLVTVHDTLAEKLDVRPKHWSEVLEKDIEIRNLKSKFTTEHFETDREACISDLTLSIAKMRDSIVMLDKNADLLIESLTAAEEPKQLPFPRYKDRGCNADCRGDGCHDASAVKIMVQRLSDFYSGIPGEKAGYEGLCRELPSAIEASEAVKQCEEKCWDMDHCKGFAFYDGEIPHFSRSVYDNVSDSVSGKFHSVLGSTPNRTNRVPNVWDHVWVWKTKWLEFSTCGNRIVVLAPEELPCADPRCKKKTCEEESQMCRRCQAGRLPVQCGQKFLGCFAEQSVYLQAKPTSLEVLRNRCCFQTSVANELWRQYPQEYSNCFVKPLSNSLRSLEPQQIAKVLEGLSSSHSGALKEDLGQASERILSENINGLALSAMGEVKLKQYLKISNPGNLHKIQCMLDALKVGGTPQRCSDSSFMEFWGRVHTFVEPAVFWIEQFESGVGQWSVEATNRITSIAMSFMKNYNLISEATYDHATDYVDGSSRAHDEYISVGELIDLGTRAFAIHSSFFNPLVLASQVIWLVKQAAMKSWDHCWMVQNWLSKTNVVNSVKSDAVVEAAFTETGDLPVDDPCVDENKCESEVAEPEVDLD